MVKIAADLRQVAVIRERRVLAEHERLWSRGPTATDPLHVQSSRPVARTIPTTSAGAGGGAYGY
ncbi:hypothetical protein [Rhodococcus qingshengii]|uniref:hypothetical protein n=1 Tax=Rhodococcus qingshengii TaxID=334542 RepID=UPI0035DC22EE